MTQRYRPLRRLRPSGRAFAVAAHPRRVRAGRPASRSTTTRSTRRRTNFAAALAAFAATGGNGANVTLPHKQARAGAVRRSSASARAAPARSTRWYATTTAGTATTPTAPAWCATSPIATALDLRGRRTLLLGAGGAAHGVAPALLDAGIGELFIVNRHPERADALADALGEPGRVHTRYWDDLANAGRIRFDHQRHLGRSRGAARSALPLRHRHAAHPGGRPELWRGGDRVPGLGAQPRTAATPSTASACWSSRRRKVSSSGTACGRRPMRSTPSFVRNRSC